MNLLFMALIFTISILGFNACSTDDVTDMEDVVVAGEDDSDFETIDWTDRYA